MGWNEASHPLDRWKELPLPTTLWTNHTPSQHNTATTNESCRCYDLYTAIGINLKIQLTVIMRFIPCLSCLTAMVLLAVDGSNASTGSNTTLAQAKKSENTIIINANQDSRNIEKAIKSLETILEENFQQLIHVINATSLGNPNTGSGKMWHVVLKLSFFWFLFSFCF